MTMLAWNSVVGLTVNGGTVKLPVVWRCSTSHGVWRELSKVVPLPRPLGIKSTPLRADPQLDRIVLAAIAFRSCREGNEEILAGIGGRGIESEERQPQGEEVTHPRGRILSTAQGRH